MKDDYFFQCNDGLILFVGHIKIKSDPFMNLSPGDRITQVGLTKPKENPGSAAINRTDKFKPYITYVGTRVEPDMSEGQNFLLIFQVREEDKPPKILKEDNMYIAYIVLYHDKGIIELKSYDHSVPVFRILQPHFDKLSEP